MASFDQKLMGVARIWARALIDRVDQVEAPERADALLAELQELAHLTEAEPSFAAFLASPLVTVEQRRDALEAIFRGRSSDLLVDALQVMNRKGRLGLLPTVVETFRREVRDRRGEVDVEVRTAVPLSPELRERVAGAVAGLTGRKPQLHESVDPALIGGVVLRMGDRKIDASVARELERVAGRLRERASRELQSKRSYVEGEG